MKNLGAHWLSKGHLNYHLVSAEVCRTEACFLTSYFDSNDATMLVTLLRYHQLCGSGPRVSSTQFVFLVRSACSATLVFETARKPTAQATQLYNIYVPSIHTHVKNSAWSLK